MLSDVIGLLRFSEESFKGRRGLLDFAHRVPLVALGEDGQQALKG